MGVSGFDKFDHVDCEAVYGSLTVGNTAVEVKVGASPLAMRKQVIIQALDNQIYWGYDSSVTTSTGTRIFKNDTLFLPIGVDIRIWLIANGNNRDVRIGELS